MKYFIPKDITISDSSIPENSDSDGVIYPSWINGGYFKGSKVAHLGCLYEAQTNIYPLATYEWNDISKTITSEITRFVDGVTVDPTVVPCVKDETVVYIKDTWKIGGDDVIDKFFMYIGNTGDVDFTIIKPDNYMTQFRLVKNYSVSIFEPRYAETSLYWRYIGRTNRNKCADKAYNSQSVANAQNEAWWEFYAFTPDRISLFNIAAQRAKVTIYTDDINTPVYEKELDNLLDTSSIINWRTLVRFREIYKNTVSWDIPFLTGGYKVRVTLMGKGGTPMDLKLGEILYGEKGDLGLTLDTVPIQLKSSGKITEKENGEIILDSEGDVSKIFAIYNLTLVYNSYDQDVIMKKCSDIINRRIVITAEDIKEENFRSLTVYGFIRDTSPTLVTSDGKSKIQIQLQRFI